jgi:hypothetical protein
MLGNSPFYHNLIKKYIICFGSLFNSILITRTDKAGNEIEKMKVPLSWSAKDKLLARLVQDPAIQKQAAITLPRMGFELTHMNYDKFRKLNKIGQIVTRGSDPNHLKTIYNPVAFDFAFSLYVYVKNSDDACKIVEQILPFFTPEYTVRAILIPEMNIIMDIPIIHNGVTIEDNYTGPLTVRQALIYQLDFTLKGYLYGPMLERPVIKFVEFANKIGTPANSESTVERFAIYPGETANGNRLLMLP